MKHGPPIRVRLAAVWAVLMLVPCVHAFAAAAVAFSYTSPSGIAFTVTPGGLSKITTGERQLASGGWSAFNAENWFKDGGSQVVKSEPAGARSLEVIDDHHVRVRQAGGDLVCAFDYTFDGEDVLISARIENNNSESAMNIVGFTGLEFHFAQLPTGLMPVQHITYFQMHGVAACHPGFWEPVGGTYATDNSIGVGTSPWNTGLVRTLTLWDYADWNPGKKDSVPDRLLRYYVVSPVPARGAATFDFVLTVSPNRDWKHLLGKYREYFQKTYGTVQYKQDARWIGTDYLNQDKKAITPTNPYGFYGGSRRIDTLAGAMSFCDHTILPLKQTGGQGMIVWGQGGEDPRGCMYRPDFDVLPPEVEENWRIIARRYKQAGLKLGVATRPRDLAVRLDWKNDATVFINAYDESDRNMLWQRFSNMMDRGCTLFYLDSFGDGFEDIGLMQFLRQKMGLNVLTFCEHQSDAIMPYSGGYTETTFTPGENGAPGSYRLWADMHNWEIYRWLCPGAQMAARLLQGTPKVSDLDPNVWCFGNYVTPLIPVDDFQGRLFTVQQVEGKYVDPKGQWR
jgi:hypothetical protein